MKVYADSTRCQGHLRCHEVAPDVFGYDDDGYVVLLVAEGQVPEGREGEVQLAVHNCPEGALVVGTTGESVRQPAAGS